MSTPEASKETMVQMLANGWIKFCWQKIEEIEADPQGGAANQERLDVLLTYMELLNNTRHKRELSAEQEEIYGENLDWIRVRAPHVNTSKLD